MIYCQRRKIVFQPMVTLLAFYSAIVVDSFISTAQNGVCLSLKSLSAGTKEKLTESKRISNVLGSRFTKEKIRISQKRKWREYYFQFYKLNLFNLKKILKSLLCQHGRITYSYHDFFLSTTAPPFFFQITQLQPQFETLRLQSEISAIIIIPYVY